MSTPCRRAPGGAGFTLVEVMVSTTLVIFLLLILVNITNQTGRIWKYTSGKVEEFREAREAFESMTRKLSQATLNTYWDYDNQTTPTKYIRKSELRFQSGLASTIITGPTTDHPTHAIFFQAPLGYTETPTDYPGLVNLLNTCGYFIQNGPDLERPAFIVSAKRNRYRLMEYLQPTEKLSVYPDSTQWLTDLTSPSITPTTPIKYTRSIAENIVALIVTPRLSVQEDLVGDKLAPDYTYDSTTDGTNGSNANYNTKNQLPPEVQVTMVAIDESSAALLASLHNSTMPTLLDPTWFSGGSSNGAAKYADDLKSVQQKLATKPTINYRIFSTNVRIRGAKWSRQ